MDQFAALVCAVPAVALLMVLVYLAARRKIDLATFFLVNTPLLIIITLAVSSASSLLEFNPLGLCSLVIQLSMAELMLVGVLRRKEATDELTSRFDGSPFGPQKKQR